MEHYGLLSVDFLADDAPSYRRCITGERDEHVPRTNNIQMNTTDHKLQSVTFIAC